MKTARTPLHKAVSVKYAVIILLTILGFSFGSNAQRKNLTFSCDFEGTTPLSTWPMVVGRTTQSSTYSREGSYSARVEVVKGDAMIASGARSEMNLNPISSVPAEQWFGISYYIPTSWASDYDKITDILAQWHSESGTPPIAFGINVANWYVQFQNSGVINLGAVKKGAWTDVVFHMKWSTGSSGLTEIWINGTKVETYSGSNFPDTSPGPFFKCGDYKWPWNTGSGEGEPSLVTDRLLYIDAVRVGNASATYSDVAPGTSTTTTTPPATTGAVITLTSTQTITLPTSSATLSATATDATSSINSISWSQVSGPNSSTIKSSSSLSTTASGLIAGTYVYKLTVIDDLKITTTATITVTVNAAASTSAPVVNAGSDQSVTLPTTTATLKGSATDASATISSYAWTQSSGPNTAKIASSSAATTAISGLAAGTYVFSLKVTDSKSKTGTDQVTVVVNAAAGKSANKPPVADAGDDQTITLPTNSTVLFGYSTDPDGTIASYNWVKTSGPSGGTIASPSAAKPTVTNLIAGMYIFTLTVTDNQGATNSNAVMVTVVQGTTKNTANTAPTANAGSDQTTTATSVTLNGANSSDADGSISSYAWTKVSGTGGSISSPSSVKTTVSSLRSGSYVFQLVVTDNKGATATDKVTITVRSTSGNSEQAALLVATDTDTAESITISGDTTVNDAAAAGIGTTIPEAASESILLFPNPAESIINLRLHSSNTGNMKITVFDMTGKAVRIFEENKTQNAFDGSFNIAGLAHGMYTLQAIIGTRKPLVSKFLKQ